MVDGKLLVRIGIVVVAHSVLCLCATTSLFPRDPQQLSVRPHGQQPTALQLPGSVTVTYAPFSQVAGRRRVVSGFAHPVLNAHTRQQQAQQMQRQARSQALAAATPPLALTQQRQRRQRRRRLDTAMRKFVQLLKEGGGRRARTGFAVVVLSVE